MINLDFLSMFSLISVSPAVLHSYTKHHRICLDSAENNMLEDVRPLAKLLPEMTEGEAKSATILMQAAETQISAGCI